MSDHNAACFVVEEDHSYVMVLTREYFQTFTDLPIGDPAVNPSVSTAIFLDSREAVDATVADGLAAGGTEPHPAIGLRLHVPAPAQRPRRQHPRVRLVRPGRRSPEPRGVREPAGLRSVAARDYGQYCGVTQALELVGERWALLIVRDLLVGPRRYGELAAGLPRIPSNILAARLKELQEAGVIRRVPRSRIIIYELTPYGRELEPVVLALGAWGFKAMGDPRDEQIITPDSMTMTLRTAFRPHGGRRPARDRLRGAPRSRRAAHPRRRLHPRRDARGRTGRPRLRRGPGHPPAHLRRARPGPRDRDRRGRGAARAAATSSTASRARSTWPPERSRPGLTRRSPRPARRARAVGVVVRVRLARIHVASGGSHDEARTSMIDLVTSPPTRTTPTPGRWRGPSRSPTPVDLAIHGSTDFSLDVPTTRATLTEPHRKVHRLVAVPRRDRPTSSAARLGRPAARRQLAPRRRLRRRAPRLSDATASAPLWSTPRMQLARDAGRRVVMSDSSYAVRAAPRSAARIESPTGSGRIPARRHVTRFALARGFALEQVVRHSGARRPRSRRVVDPLRRDPGPDYRVHHAGRVRRQVARPLPSSRRG